MMTRRRARKWVIFLLLMLAVGYILFAFKTDAFIITEDPNFRIWFWENRTTDLFIQVALIFAGVLGVVIILDSGKEVPK